MRLVLVFLFALVACRSDDLGRDAPSPRIVSLIPNATEVLFELGMGEHVVGATRYCDRPEGAKKVPRVGGILDVSAEAVLAAGPDLVIGSPKVLRGHLKDVLNRTGADVLALDFDTTDSVAHGIGAIGEAVGREGRAGRIIRSLLRDLDALQDRALHNPRIKVLFVAGRNPIVVASGASFIGDLLERMGVENAVKAVRVPYPTWSLEQMIRADPDVIVDGAMDAGGIQGPLSSAGIRAAREGRIVAPRDQAILRPGTGAAKAALDLADDILKAVE